MSKLLCRDGDINLAGSDYDGGSRVKKSDPPYTRPVKSSGCWVVCRHVHPIQEVDVLSKDETWPGESDMVCLDFVLDTRVNKRNLSYPMKWKGCPVLVVSPCPSVPGGDEK